MSVVTRPRVSARLSSAARRPLTLIAAPPGCGKTTALRHFLEEKCPTHTLLELTPADNSASAFMRSLADACGGLVPGLRTSYASAFEYAQQSAKSSEELAVWFYEHLRNIHATIAVDNFHYAAPNPDVEKIIVKLVESAPAKLRWILSSREPFSLPVASWVESGIAAPVLTESDLLLTKDEAISAGRSKNLSSEHIAALYDMTCGWPLAYALGLRLPHWIKQLEALEPQSTQGLYAFLAERMFSEFDTAVQDLLLSVSVFTAIGRRLIAVTQGVEAWHRLEAVGADGLLLCARGDDELRFHDLFRSFLETKLRERGDGAFQAALIRGAHSLMEIGERAEALRLLTRAQDPTHILRFCEQHGLELLDQGADDVLGAAIAQLSDDSQHDSPAVSAIKAIGESKLGRHDTSEAWFLHAIHRADGLASRADIANRYVLDLLRRGRLDRVGLLEPYVQERALPEELQAAIRSTLAVAYVISARFSEAREMMDGALRVVPPTAPKFVFAKIYHHVGWVALFTGDVPRAKEYAALAVHLALQENLYDLAARAYTVLYNVAYDVEDDPQTAIQLLHRILDCGLKAGSAEIRLFALLGSYDIRAERAETEALERLQQALSAYELDYADSRISEGLLPAEALQLASKRRFREAYDLLSPTCERRMTPDRLALRYSEVALYAAAAGLPEESAVACDRVQANYAELEAPVPRTVRTRLNYSLALALLGRDRDASIVLRDVDQVKDLSSARLAAYADAVTEILDRWNGKSNHHHLYQALRRLKERGLGGIAAMLSGLARAPHDVREKALA